METLPPAGVAPTIGPPARHRGTRAIVLGALGVALLAVALAWHVQAQAAADGVVVADRQEELGSALRRLLFGLSGLAQIGSVIDARSAFHQARGAASLAFALSAAWLAAVAWAVLR